MSRLNYSRTLIAGTRENVRDIQSMLLEARAAIGLSKLTGAENFKPKTLGPGKYAAAAVDLSELAVDALGVAGGAVASWRAQGQIVTPDSTPGAGGTIEVTLTGATQPGDLVLIHRAYTLVSGSTVNRRFSCVYTDGVGSVQVDGQGSNAMTENTVGWGIYGFKTAGCWIRATRGSGGPNPVVRMNIFNNVVGAAGISIFEARLIVVLLRLT